MLLFTSTNQMGHGFPCFVQSFVRLGVCPRWIGTSGGVDRGQTKPAVLQTTIILLPPPSAQLPIPYLGRDPGEGGGLAGFHSTRDPIQVAGVLLFRSPACCTSLGAVIHDSSPLSVLTNECAVSGKRLRSPVPFAWFVNCCLRLGWIRST